MKLRGTPMSWGELYWMGLAAMAVGLICVAVGLSLAPTH